MQLPRVVIAAVFFVIGALIAIPALIDGTGGESSASTAATTSPGPSGGPDPSGSPSPSAAPAPLTASIGSRVSCPDRTVRVTVRNTGDRTEDFGIEKDDGTAAVPGQIPANSTRTVSVRLRGDRTTRVTVNWANKRIESATVKANCEKAGAAPAKPPEELPHTGPDAVLWARAATGVAVILTGAIIFWYGGIWPRRRDRVFPEKSK